MSYFEKVREKLSGEMEIFCLEQVDSTNTFLKKRAGEHKMLALALRQTAGRGRLGRVWSSEGENIYASFYYPLRQIKTDALTLCVALAVSDAVEEFGAQVLIKWPNDIYAGEKKLCGILCEAIYQGAKLRGIVVGIGVNANQERFSGDAANGISLKHVLGKPVDRAEVLCCIYKKLEARLEGFLKEGFGAFQKEYIRRSYLQGKEVTAGALSGVCIGVSQEGELLLQRGTEVRKVRFGEALQKVRPVEGKTEGELI